MMLFLKLVLTCLFVTTVALVFEFLVFPLVSDPKAYPWLFLIWLVLMVVSMAGLLISLRRDEIKKLGRGALDNAARLNPKQLPKGPPPRLCLPLVPWHLRTLRRTPPIPRHMPDRRVQRSSRRNQRLPTARQIVMTSPWLRVRPKRILQPPTTGIVVNLIATRMPIQKAKSNSDTSSPPTSGREPGTRPASPDPSYNTPPTAPLPGAQIRKPGPLVTF